MIRKIIGWTLAIISVILLLLTMGVGIYGYSSSKIELATTVFQIRYLQLIIPQYFISNKSGIWSLSLIVHSKG